MRWAVFLLLVSCKPAGFVPCEPLPSSYAIDCDTHPELCDLPSTTIATANDARAYKLVFLPEGFTADQLPAFHRHVRELVTDLWHDEGGIVAMERTLFDAHVVEVPSTTSLLDNGDRFDTALGGCLEEDHIGTQPFGRIDYERARLAAANAPGADAIIVVFATAEPRANASSGVIVLSRDDDAKVLTHELGHALFDLGDEYTETPEHYYERRLWAETGPWDLLGVANLTLHGTGAKWAHVQSGAVEGGARYGEGIYHPTDSCRMKDSSSDEFCRVCKAEIRERMHLRLDRTRNDGAPTCVLGSRTDPLDVKWAWTYEVRIFDRTPPVRVWIALDHVVLEEYRLTHETGAWSGQVQLRPGPHVLAAECTDRFGAISRARLEVHAH